MNHAPILLSRVSNFSSWRKLSENHTPFCAKHLRMWESEIVWLEFESDFCLTWSIDLILLLSVSNFSSQQKLSEKHMPLCVKHLRVWESKSVWLKYESDFCLSWSIAPILSSSVSNFSSWQKLSEKHTPWCEKTSESVRKWDCVNWIWEWFLTELVNCSNFSFQCLKFLILTKAFRKTYAILFQSYESVTKWDCVTLIWEWFLSIAPILLPSVQISCLNKSFQKTYAILSQTSECEKERLCDLNLRVIFVWPGQLLRFCFPVSQISCHNKSFQKYIVRPSHSESEVQGVSKKMPDSEIWLLGAYRDCLLLSMMLGTFV